MIVGLTGGIATGKSTVSEMLRDAGALIVDADIIAREAVTPGMPAWVALRALFGERIIQRDGSIDRAELGRIVFADEPLRRQLEAIIHPRVRQRMTEETERILRQSPQAVVVHDVPLLLETGMHHAVTEVIVVYVPQNIQLQRLMTRDNLTEAQALARIAAQIPIEDKRQRATIVIDNSGDLEHTHRQVRALFDRLARQAARLPLVNK